MKILTEKMVHTDKFAGQVDLITGIEDFKNDLEFNKEFHTYKHNGKILPSVTQLLDDGSYKKIDAEILKYAQEKGTIIHKEIEEWLNTRKLGFTSEVYEFVEFFDNNKELFEQKAIFDFKTYKVATPKKREKCYRQCKMYAEAVEYMVGEKINNFYMILLAPGKKAKLYNLGEEFGK